MSIAVKTKDKMFGQTFNVGEFIDALSDEVFNDDDAPISVQTQDYSGRVVAVYKCKSCERLHILGNNFAEEGDLYFTQDEVSNRISQIAETVYGFAQDIPKGDMLVILKKLDKNMDIMMETMADKEAFTLTGVYKCSEECPAIHLDSAYHEYNFKAN